MNQTKFKFKNKFKFKLYLVIKFNLNYIQRLTSLLIISFFGKFIFNQKLNFDLFSI